MKITKEEFQRSKKDSEIELFLQGIKAKETRERYFRTLRRILCDVLEEFFEGSFEQRAKRFVKSAKDDPDWIQDLMLQFSKKLKERTQLSKDDKNYLNPSTVSNYFKPIRKLLEMNNVPFAWARIKATFPELDNISETRGWTRKEISKMLKFTNGAIDRSIILVASSSSIRAGGFEVTWEDLTPIYKVGNKLKIDITESEEEKAEIVCGMLNIYKGSKESYPAFITPEAYDSLIDYKMEWAREVGREPKPKEPIFKKEGSLPIPAKSTAIRKRVERVIKNSGLRAHQVRDRKRYEVPTMNGFRRFWAKTCKEALSRDSPLASLIKKEFMMGHSGLVKLDRNYFKTQTLELAEEYLNAVPALTISDEERSKAENRKLRKEKSRQQIRQERVTKLEKELSEVKTSMKTILKEIARKAES